MSGGVRAWLIGLAALAAVSYSPAIKAPFIFDDDEAIVMNWTIGTLWPPWVPLSPPDRGSTAGRPVPNFTFAVNFAINQSLGIDQSVDPGGPYKTVVFHVTNILLHVACGFLLFGLIRRTIDSVPRLRDWWNEGGLSSTAVAGTVSALWVLHPIHSEAVNYLTQRTELLVSFFYLGTLYAGIRLWDAPTMEARRRWFAGAVALCLLGMGSKEVMVTAPLMVLLYDRAFRYRRWRDARQRLPLYSALAATALWLVFLMAGRPRGGTVGFGLGITWFEYLYTQAWAIGRYVQLTFWPDRLLGDYGIRPISGPAGVPGFIALTIFLGATVRAWLQPDKRGWFAFLGAWFFLILGPSSSVVPIVTEVAAERRFYLPLASILVLLLVGVELLRRRVVSGDRNARSWYVGTPIAAAACYAMVSGWKARTLVDSLGAEIAFRVGIGGVAAALVWSVLQSRRRVIPVALIAGALAATTWARSNTYADPIRLWEDASAKMPTNARALEHLGVALLNEGGAGARAESLFKKAIVVDPKYVPAYAQAGGSALDAGRVAEARALFEEGLRIHPRFPSLLASYGNLLLAEGDVRAAIPVLERAVVTPPSDQPLIDLATAYMLAGRPEEALEQLHAVLARDPTRTDVLRYAGMLLAQEGRSAEALQYLAEAVIREPASGLGLALLSLAYAQLDQREGAYQVANRAANLADGDAQVLLFAGRAMLIIERPQEAELYISEGVRLHPDDPNLLAALGQAKLALGKRSEAAELFRRILDAAPDHEAARQGLQQATRR